VDASDRVVVIIDDDEVFRNRLCRAFAQRNWNATSAASSEEALPLVVEHEPDLVLIDLRLASESGLDVIRQIRVKDSAAKLVMLTGYGSIATALQAIRLGADDYISKPADVDQILAAYVKLSVSDNAESVDVPQAPSLARVEWEHVQRILVDCGGNISKAARVLGIHRRSLQRKLDRYPPTL
jgi:two-component system response regulator RegA